MLARSMANGFSSLQDAVISLQQDVSSLQQNTSSLQQSVKTILATKADKADILALHDKFIHRREFDELAVRVSKIEAKIKK